MPASGPRLPGIALVIDRFDGRRGGAALWTRGFAAWLAMHDVEVHVLARDIGPAESNLPVVFHRIDAPKAPLALAAAVAARLAEIRPLLSHDMGAAVGCDVFHPHCGSGAACWEGSVASYPAWLRPVKRLCGLSPRRRRLDHISAAQFAAPCLAYIAVSHQVARDMQVRHGVPRQRVHVIHNGVDLGRFAPAQQRELRGQVRRQLGVGPDEVLLIGLAHNARLKGLYNVLRVADQLRRSGMPVRLLLCGGRPLTVRRSDALIPCGFVADAAPFYAAADICVHPTYYDACSLVTLEALAAALPVVTTRANGASELLTPGIDGIVLEDPEDDRALAAALEPLIASAALRRRLGTAGRRLAEAHDVQRNYAAVAAVYTHVLAARRQSVAPRLELPAASAAA